MSWTDLGVELRLQILKNVQETSDSVAPYTTVSRGWQEFFEERSFRSLRVRSTELNTLGAVMLRDTRRRQSYVHSLDVDIAVIPPLLWEDMPSDPRAYIDVRINNNLLSGTIQALMVLLSRWDWELF